MIAEILVELVYFRTGDKQSTQRPGDEQALMPGAVVDPRQMMEEESPAVPVIGPKADNVRLFGFPCARPPRLAVQFLKRRRRPPLIVTAQCTSPFPFLCWRSF